MHEEMSARCLLVASQTSPVAEIIRDDEENGFLVDFHTPDKIAERVIAVLEAGHDSYDNIWQNARNTIVKNYDLKTICLPAQLKLLEMALKR